MLSHPLSIIIIITELCSLYFLFSALTFSIRYLLQETEEERKKCTPVISDGNVTRSGRLVLLLQCVASGLLLLGISLVFPPILTGIMCGTGVLQISGETGIRMLLVKLCALLDLYVWYVIDCANRELPDKQLTSATSRAMLCCVPFVLMGVWLSVKTLWVLNQGQSGDCCTIAYGAAVVGGVPFTLSFWLIFLAVISIVLIFFVLRILVVEKLFSFLLMMSLCGGLVWCLTASLCLRYFFTAYYYGVTQHHCLWCLFLPRNYYVGYGFFLVFAIVFSQSVNIFVTGHVALMQNELSAWARKKIRKSTLLVIAGMIFYFLLILIPVISWKVQNSTWVV
jgi:hypothetical protein